MMHASKGRTMRRTTPLLIVLCLIATSIAADSGQVRLFGYSPVVPSRFGNRYAYGHVVENDRNLIVSGGLGFSIMPVRFGVRPEILQIDLG